MTGDYGGTGGTFFHDDHDCTVTGINKIEIWHSSTDIRGIRTQYSLSSGNTDTTDVHGSSLSDYVYNSLTLSQGETVTAVVGVTGTGPSSDPDGSLDLVRSIAILTELSSGEKKQYGPFGGTGTDLFVVHKDIVAFYGRVGSAIDSIGFYFTQ